MFSQYRQLAVSPAVVVSEKSLLASLIASATANHYSVFLPDTTFTHHHLAPSVDRRMMFAAPMLPAQNFSEQFSMDGLPVAHMNKSAAFVNREPWLIRRPFEDALQVAFAMHMAQQANASIVSQFA